MRFALFVRANFHRAWHKSMQKRQKLLCMPAVNTWSAKILRRSSLCQHMHLHKFTVTVITALSDHITMHVTHLSIWEGAIMACVVSVCS
jgi:hypothetical protein